ncbi:DUF4129 domain-containing protein [Actinomyces sp. 2119]|uniref:DUF4129 domain-containing protein n=1 Tax=Actinomyces sp. 2119 TaxID=2321393 RepID=UPI002176139F|nr:DUF4129 domain-containing protein [Actinomyces sp. 2119]
MPPPHLTETPSTVPASPLLLPSPLRPARWSPSVALAAGQAVMSGAPATPDAEEARRAAQEELSRRVYDNHPGLAERLWTWVSTRLDVTAVVPGAPPWVSVAVVVLCATAAACSLLLLLRRVAVVRRVHGLEDAVLNDDRDSAALAQAADQAATQADYATAVVERFRAVVRCLSEAGMLEEYPGMTAAEAARAASTSLGRLDRHPAGGTDASRLHRAASLFDGVFYGDITPTPSQDTWMRQLAADVADLVGSTRTRTASLVREES